MDQCSACPPHSSSLEASVACECDPGYTGDGTHGSGCDMCFFGKFKVFHFYNFAVFACIQYTVVNIPIRQGTGGLSLIALLSAFCISQHICDFDSKILLAEHERICPVHKLPCRHVVASWQCQHKQLLV